MVQEVTRCRSATSCVLHFHFHATFDDFDKTFDKYGSPRTLLHRVVRSQYGDGFNGEKADGEKEMEALVQR